MSANRPCRATYRNSLSSQAGVFVVEYALIVIVFFTFVFTIMELARMLYLWNTLQEVTRSAADMAAHTKFNDEAAKALLRQKAVFRTSPGTLPLGNPVTDGHVRIDYLALTRDPSGQTAMTPIPNSALPTCNANNRAICAANPNSASCISFVRVRICEPGSSDSCGDVGYKPMLPLLSLSFLKLPTATTIVSAESLGYSPTAAQCP